MSDANTNNDEKVILKENLDTADTVNAEVDLDDSKAKFINGGKGLDDTAVDIHVPSETASFTGLGKEDLMKYATDPFWVRLRWILFILFWVGWLAMLVAAIVIIVLAPRCPYRPDLKWYNKDVAYKVYVQSFKDSDGDGVGDLKGLKSKLGYIQKLGAKSVWLNSIFKSDNVDGGNGIVDYKDIDPQVGTLEDFESLSKEMFKQDMRLIVDFIPNHTSRNHSWFLKSQRDEVGYEDYYVWADKDNGWTNSAGQGIWSLDTVKNKYYLHTLGEEFPDLNLRNDAVRDELEKILRFWVDKGVFGFNVVGAEYLTENGNFSTQNGRDEFINYMGNLEVISTWRNILNSLSDKPGREKVLLATFPTTYDLNTTLEYFGEGEQKGFNVVPSRLFAELDQTCGASCLERKIDEEKGSIEQWRGWVFGDEDTARAGTRFPGKLGRLMRTVQMLLPGSSYVYYGDELPIKDGDKNASPAVDSYRMKNGGTVRDIFRTPMQWNNKPNSGFTEGTPYIPLSTDHTSNNVATAEAHNLNDGYHFMDLVKDLIALKEKESFLFGSLSTKVEKDVLFIYRKAEGFPAYLVATNFGDKPYTISMYAGEGGALPKKVMVVFSSNKKTNDDVLNVDGQGVVVPAKSALVLKFIE